LGDGPERRHLEDLARTLGLGDHMTFAGHVPHTRVLDEMASAELVLLPSSSFGERLPNALKEAMASRCVVITSPTPGIAELVENGGNGFIHEAADAAGIAATITRLLGDRSQYEAIAAAAQRTVRERFDAGVSMAHYHTLWLTACAHRRARPKT
jgi:glycosyltransferase involved in cell wall biosynthesis